MNKYDILKSKHQERFNSLPIGFAFSNEQFEEMMQNWGLKPTQTDKICYVFGKTGFARKADLPLIKETIRKNDDEMAAAIADDKDGTGFIRDMFVSEMFNHEYGLTLDISEVLSALGITAETVNSDVRFQNAFKLAHEYVLENTF